MAVFHRSTDDSPAGLDGSVATERRPAADETAVDRPVVAEHSAAAAHSAADHHVEAGSVGELLPPSPAMGGPLSSDVTGTPNESVDAVDSEPAAVDVEPERAGTITGPAGEGTDAEEQRWRELLVSFVDAPRDAVDAAQALVSEELARVVRALEGERDRLRDGLSGGSTEDLRVAMKGLRALSGRLHSMPR